jgi:CRP-like cAMP-binding protein
MFVQIRQFINQHIQLSDEEFQTLASKFHPVSFDKKTKVVEIGDIATTIYFVIKGLTRRYFYRGKQEVITHLVTENGIMGSVISFLTGEPSKYILETIEPVTALAISKQDLEGLFLSDKKWEKFGRKILTSFFLQIEYRNLDNIRFSTKERFINFMKQNPDLVMRVPQKYLASYLEIQPETFSRLKHLMVKEK